MIIESSIAVLIGTLFAGISTLIAGRSLSKIKYKDSVTEDKSNYSSKVNHIKEKSFVNEKIKLLEDKFFDNDVLTFNNPAFTTIKTEVDEITKATILENKFYEQALHQSKVHFWFSVIVASIGFIFIIVIVIVSIYKNEYTFLINTIPGVVVDAIAFLFFKQSSDIRNKATEYFDKLNSDNKKQKSMELVRLIENSKLKDLIYAQIAINTSGISTTADEFSEIISLLNNDGTQNKE